MVSGALSADAGACRNLISALPSAQNRMEQQYRGATFGTAVDKGQGSPVPELNQLGACVWQQDVVRCVHASSDQRANSHNLDSRHMGAELLEVVNIQLARLASDELMNQSPRLTSVHAGQGFGDSLCTDSSAC
jgi:hypothetical protein